MRIIRLFASVAVMLIIPGAWAGGPGHSVPVTSVYRDAHCVHREEAGAVRLDDPSKLAVFTEGGVIAEVDFGQRLLIGVSMGLKPTPGYWVRLEASDVPVNDGTVSVPIEWRRPPADAIQPQVVSWPCLIVSLPRGGDYRAIRFVDRDGHVRARLETTDR